MSTGMEIPELFDPYIEESYSPEEHGSEAGISTDPVTLYFNSIRHLRPLDREQITELAQTREAGILAEAVLDMATTPDRDGLRTELYDLDLKAGGDYYSKNELSEIPEDLTKQQLKQFNVGRAELRAKLFVDWIENKADEALRDPALAAGYESLLGEAEQAAALIIGHNLNWVKTRVLKYKGHAESRGITYIELMAAGNEGMHRALEKYDHSRDVTFTSYATLWIDAFVREYIASMHNAVHMTPRARHAWKRVKGAEKELFENNKNTSDENIAAQLEMEPDEVGRIRQFADPALYLDHRSGIDGEGSTLEELLPSDSHDTMQQDVVYADMQARVAAMLDLLEPDEAEFIRLKFGFGYGEPKRRAEVAGIMGMTTSTALNMEKRIMAKLKGLASPELKEYFAA